MMPPQGPPSQGAGPSPAQQPPQGQPAPQQQQQGGASKVVGDIHSGMMALMDMMGHAPSIAPQEKQKFAGIIKAFESFVTEDLGAGGPKKAAPSPAQAPSPMEAGGKPATPAM